LSFGNYPKKIEILKFIEPLRVLERSLDLERVVAVYIENFVMPKSLVGDAIHLAYASYYGIDYLLTWNCNHLANARKWKHIKVINGRLGLSTPEIVTPLNLVEEINETR
jgi:predicted nucleic acid-binding protein